MKSSQSLRRAAGTAAESLLVNEAKNLPRTHLIEPLESRQYLTTSIAFSDDPGINNYYIRQSAGQIQVFQNQPLTSMPIQQVPVADMGAITIACSSSNDSITLDYSGGDPIPGGLTYLAEAAVPAITPSLHVVGLANATYQLGWNFLDIAASGVSDTVGFVGGIANTEFDLFSGGGTDQLNVTDNTTVTFNSNLGAGGAAVGVNVSSGALLTFASTETLASLNIAAGGPRHY